VKKKAVYSILYYGVPVVILAVFVAALNSVPYLKRPIGPHDDVPGLMAAVEAHVVAGRWDQARADVERLITAWDMVARRIQFTAGRDKLTRISANLARLRGAVMAEDRTGALVELGEAREQWDSLER